MAFHITHFDLLQLDICIHSNWIYKDTVGIAIWKYDYSMIEIWFNIPVVVIFTVHSFWHHYLIILSLKNNNEPNIVNLKSLHSHYDSPAVVARLFIKLLQCTSSICKRHIFTAHYIKLLYSMLNNAVKSHSRRWLFVSV